MSFYFFNPFRFFGANHWSHKIMATLEEVKAAIASLKDHVSTENGQVSAKLADLAAQIQALKDQIANGTVVSSTDLDALVASVTEITGQVDAIIPDAPPVPDPEPVPVDPNAPV